MWTGIIRLIFHKFMKVLENTANSAVLVMSTRRTNFEKVNSDIISCAKFLSTTLQFASYPILSDPFALKIIENVFSPRQNVFAGTPVNS